MKYQLYPTYTDSGAEWIGDIPEHWELSAVKRCYDTQLGKMLQNTPLSEQDVKVPYLKAANVLWERVVVDELQEMWASPREVEQYTVQHGDMLVCEGGEAGRAAILDVVSPMCIIQNALHRVRSLDGNNLKFLLYLLRHATSCGWMEVLCNKATITHFTSDKLANLELPLPPPKERTVITSFLDCETAQIDALISKQERLISVLQEKRNALVPIAGSEVNVERMSSVADVILRPVVQRDGEVYTPLGLLNRGRGLFHKESRAMAEMGDSDFFWIKNGDLIISGQFAWEGAVALAGRDEENCVVSHRYHVLRGKKGVALTEYIYAVLATKHGNFLLNENSRGAAGRNRPLNIGSLMKEHIPVPPIRMQEAIKDLLYKELQLRKKIDMQVKLLNERRLALITGVVTGKIDVRNQMN